MPAPTVSPSKAEPAPDPAGAVQEDHTLFIIHEFVVEPSDNFAERGPEPLVPVGYGILCLETRRSLSEKSGVSTGTLWNLEKRRKNERFHLNTLNKLSRALEVDPTELISGE
jgi:DNA-binding Xre family transcriptional regulator